MNKICSYINDKSLSFAVIRPMKKVNYKLFTNGDEIIRDENILTLYNKISKVYGNKIKVIESKMINEKPLLNYIYEQFSELGYTKNQITNSLSYFLYNKTTTRKKNLFWILFGEIAHKNLLNNIDENTIVCKKCGIRKNIEHFKNRLCKNCRSSSNIKRVKCVECNIEFEVNKKNNSKIRCNNCQSKYRLEYDRNRKKNKNSTSEN